MFANLFQFRTPRAPAGPVRAFIAAVNVSRPEPRDPRVEKIVLAGWSLIVVKHVAVIWAVHHYAMPFDQLWINGPTFLLGLPAMAAYCARP